jgi:Thioredoxin-related protein
MRKIFLYMAILCISLFHLQALNAQEKIFKGTYAECQAQAKKENKLILIDLYFVGCIPCAQMDKEVFPNADVIKELNKNYLLYKTDVMKEMDGKKLARKYGAPGFPTFVIVNPDGKTILTESGFFSVDRLIALLQEAKQQNNAQQYLAFNTTLDNPYPAAYSERFIKTGEKHDFAELESYLDQQQDLFNETAILANSVTGFTKYNNWAYNNLPKLINMYGGNLMRNKIINIAKAKSREFGNIQQLDSLQNMFNYIRPTFTDRLWDVFLPTFITNYYTGSKDAQSYLTLIDDYKVYPNWDERSNALGPIIIDQSNNPTILQAIRVQYLRQQQSLDIVDNYRLALLHYYLKDYDKAAKSIANVLNTSNSPYFSTNKNQFLALKKAIDEKDGNSFQFKDIKKIIPLKLS